MNPNTVLDAHLVKDTIQELPAEPPQTLTADEVRTYLNANPRNSVVITGFKDDFHGHLTGEIVQIWRGGNDDLNEFCYAVWPISEPDETLGEDLTADEALGFACGMFC